MRKIKKYILLFIFLSFALTSKVFASAVNWEVNLPKGTVFPLEMDGYTGVSCIGDSSHITEVYSNNGTYFVKWKDGSNDNLSGSEYLTCTYESSPYVPASAPDDDKKIILHVNFGSVSTSYQVTFQMFKEYLETADLFNLNGVNQFTDLKEIVQTRKITGGKYDSGKDYVSINCPEGSNSVCVIKLKDTLPIDNSIRWAMYEIDYKTNAGNVVTAKFNIELLSNMMVMAYQ